LCMPGAIAHISGRAYQRDFQEVERICANGNGTEFSYKF
jgi:hypothetical protein